MRYWVKVLALLQYWLTNNIPMTRITLLLLISLLATSSPSWANQVSREDLAKLRQYGAYLPRLSGGGQTINLQVNDTPPRASEQLRVLLEYSSHLHLLYLDRVALAEQLEAQRQRKALLDGIAQDYAERGAHFDTELQLLWMRCAFGQEWTMAGDCGGVAQMLPLAQAQLIAADYQFNGYDDWRLPSVDELRGLVGCAEGDSQLAPNPEQCQDNSFALAVGNQLFPNNPVGIYWSQSQSLQRSYFNQAVESSSGKIYHVDKAYSYYLRLVRSTDY